MTITKVLYHPAVILGVSIVAIIFFFSLNKSAKKTQNSSENIRVLEHEVNQISTELIELEEKIELTESEQFKEKVVRNELLLQKPGEYILQISDSQEDVKSEIADSNTVVTTKRPLQQWLELIF